MNRYFAAGAVWLACALLVVILAGCQDAPALNVNDVAADPAAYSGTITVAGVAAGFARQDQTIFGVMDLKELQCKSPNCNKLLLPVRYQGGLPALGAEVRITGKFVGVAGGYVFAAEQIQVVRNHQLGG
jgi:hypothetical protein